MKRSTFIKTSTIVTASLPALIRAVGATCYKKLPVPVTRITNSTAFHWFGYYDKWQFDPAGRYVLGMEVGFEGRPPGHTSRFVWRDPQHICAYTKPPGKPMGFYVLEDKTGKSEQIGAAKMPVNGHQTCLPNHHNEWLLNDCYPQADRMQTPYFYHNGTDKRIDLGHFFSPEAYKGEWRCDLHPRFSPDGQKVVIDSTHEGIGRQMYLLDISKLAD